MKFGMRKPNPRKSFSMRFGKGRMTRSVKSFGNPFYGKKGTGFAKNPRRSTYNHIYNQTTNNPIIPYFSSEHGNFTTDINEAIEEEKAKKEWYKYWNSCTIKEKKEIIKNTKNQNHIKIFFSIFTSIMLIIWIIYEIVKIVNRF